MTLLCILGAIAAFTLFGLSTDAHYQQHMGARLTARRKARMRASAWLCVVIAFPPAILGSGWVFGPILWLGALMLGAGVVFIALHMILASKAQTGDGRR